VKKLVLIIKGDLIVANPGIYCLVLQNSEAEVVVGALGKICFKEGFYIYTGSALGSGGLLRVKRHFSLAERKDKNPRWHIDYLLLSDKFSPVYAVFAETTERLECRVAERTGGENVSGFGCSDCFCSSHLFFRDYDPFDEICSVFLSLGLNPQRTGLG
jgi:Uri superfamily endonuclease